MRDKHLETNYKCCTSDVDGITRHCALPDQSEDCKCNHYKTQFCGLYFYGLMLKTCFFVKLNDLATKDDSN